MVRNRLLAVGGFNGKTFLNTLETLDCAPVDADGEPEWTAFVDRQTWLLERPHRNDSASEYSTEDLEDRNLIGSGRGSRESSSGISGC